MKCHAHPPIPDDSALTAPTQSRAVMAASTADPLSLRISAAMSEHTATSADTAPDRERGGGGGGERRSKKISVKW